MCHEVTCRTLLPARRERDDLVVGIEDHGFASLGPDHAVDHEPRSSLEARDVGTAVEDQGDRPGLIGDDAARLDKALAPADRDRSHATGDVGSLAEGEVADRLGADGASLEGEVGLELGVVANPTGRHLVVVSDRVDIELIAVDPVGHDGRRGPRHVGHGLGDGVSRAVVEEPLET